MAWANWRLSLRRHWVAALIAAAALAALAFLVAATIIHLVTLD